MSTLQKYMSCCALAFAGGLTVANAADAAPASAGKDAIRTLEAINIEGEVAVPQVLFITARDVRRFRDGLSQTYRPSALDVARTVEMPRRVRLVATPRLTKEEQR